MFKRTTAINKILTLKKFVRGVQGGTSAGKTFGILPILINQCTIHPLLEVSVVAESIPHLKRGAMKDFKKIMTLTSRWFDERWNASDYKYTFGNGSQIEFFSADNDAKLRGARRDILYMNECNNMTFHSYTELASRTKQCIYLDWNPTNAFWFHTDLKDDEDVDFLTINYLDNESCPESAKSFIEKAKIKSLTSEYWRNWYNVYGLGEIGSLQGVVFSDWQQVDNIPIDAKLMAYGCDFGYSNDPTTITAIYQYNNLYYYDELIYQTGLTNNEIAKLFNAKGGLNDVYIYADSAEPKSIQELKNFGLNIRPAEKGKDSIMFGIQRMQENKFFVTSQSVNLIKELRMYTWDTDRAGTKLNKPIDAFNHCFVGETMIRTNKGDIRIDSIKVGDYVLTSKGYKKVLKTFDNGIKSVNKYSMQFDTFLVSLCSTKEHKIKTKKEWKPISKLQSQDLLFLFNVLTEKIINFTKTKDILVEEQKDYIQKFGSIIKAKFQKDMIFTTLTIIPTIMKYQILIWFIKLYIKGLRVNKDLKTILNGLKTFMRKVLKRQKNGINQQKDYNGIQNMEKRVGIKENIFCEIVRYVKRNIKRHSQIEVNTAIKTAKLKHLELGESYQAQVYDIMVEDCHEYFANGILVHNCIDGIRYYFTSKDKFSGKYYIDKI
jgi:phage terminase large subunit